MKTKTNKPASANRKKLPRARVMYAYTSEGETDGWMVTDDSNKHYQQPCAVIPARTRREARELLKVARFFAMTNTDQLLAISRAIGGCSRPSNDNWADAIVVLAAIRKAP